MIEETKRRYKLYRHYGHGRMTAFTLAIPPHFFYGCICATAFFAAVIFGRLR